MDLDESGVEAFEAEAAASNAESTPTTFANVTPLTSSTPRTNVVVVENSTPVATKTRKPRGLKKVEEEEKEKVEDPPTKIKEEKLPEEKKLPTVRGRTPQKNDSTFPSFSLIVLGSVSDSEDCFVRVAGS